MSAPKKKYKVNLDMKWSHDILVTASNLPEAKRKAVEKLIKKLKPSDFNIYPDEV